MILYPSHSVNHGVYVLSIFLHVPFQYYSFICHSFYMFVTTKRTFSCLSVIINNCLCLVSRYSIIILLPFILSGKSILCQSRIIKQVLLKLAFEFIHYVQKRRGRRSSSNYAIYIASYYGKQMPKSQIFVSFCFLSDHSNMNRTEITCFLRDKK